MIGYILTEEQAVDLKRVFFNQETFFWPVRDINSDPEFGYEGIPFLLLSEEDKQSITGTEWEWILSLPTGEYVPPLSPF